jgi:hypothetical protein
VPTAADAGEAVDAVPTAGKTTAALSVTDSAGDDGVGGGGEAKSVGAEKFRFAGKSSVRK